MQRHHFRIADEIVQFIVYDISQGDPNQSRKRLRRGLGILGQHQLNHDVDKIVDVVLEALS